MSKYNLATKEDFLFEVQIRLATIELREDIKRALWGAANDMAESYEAARGTGLASMFLSSLDMDTPPVLFTPPPLDYKLPESVFTTYMSTTDSEYIDKKKNREARITNIIEALENGWEDDEAICFAAAKDEWREAKKRYRQKHENQFQSRGE